MVSPGSQEPVSQTYLLIASTQGHLKDRFLLLRNLLTPTLGEEPEVSVFHVYWEALLGVSLVGRYPGYRSLTQEEGGVIQPACGPAGRGI